MGTPKRSLETRGARYITTGGAGYVPPSSDNNAFYEKLSSLFNYAKGYLSSKLGFGSDDIFMNLSNDNVVRVNKRSNNLKSILANEFIEKKSNNIRKKKDFVNTKDTLIGDKNIPLRDISTYYGIENGKLKAGDLSIFGDNTVVIPNRTKHVGKIKKLVDFDENSNSPELEKYLTEYNKNKGYKEPEFYTKLRKHIGFLRPMTQRSILLHNAGSQVLRDVINSGGYAITEQGDTISMPNINATPKVMFADENGNSAFVSNTKNQKVAAQLNKFLAEHPSYPIIIDNGRYSTYVDKDPDVMTYSGLGNPDDMFIIGTRNKKKSGGYINRRSLED